MQNEFESSKLFEHVNRFYREKIEHYTKELHDSKNQQIQLNNYKNEVEQEKITMQNELELIKSMLH